MGITSNPSFIRFMKSFSRVAGGTTVLMGGLVLLGWIFDISVLKGIIPGFVSMKANTALAFVLAGLALWLLLKKPTSQLEQRVAQVCAWAVILLGLLTLGEYIFGWQIGIDQLLFKEQSGSAGTFHPGRMSPVTALNFVLLGVALFCLDRGTVLGDRFAHFLALLVMVLSGLVLLGYLYGATILYGVGAYSQIAIHTAVAFIIMAAGVLWAYPGRGLMVIVTGENAGSLMVRRLLFTAIILPVILGWLSLQGQRAGLYDTELGLALIVSSGIVVFIVILARNALILNQADAELKLAQTTDLRQSEERLRYISWATRDAVWDRNLITNQIWWNESLQKLLHYRADEIESSVSWWEQHIHTEDREKVTRSIQAVLETRQHLWSKEYRFRRADGSYADIFDRSYILHDEQTGQPQRMIGVMTDITEQKQVEHALRQSEELFAKAFIASPVGIALTRVSDGHIVEVNNAYLKLIEYNRSEIYNQIIVELDTISMKDRTLLMKILEEQGNVREFEVGMLTKSGQRKIVLISLEQVEVGGDACILSVVQDITARKQAEEALAQEQYLLNTLLENAPDYIYFKDAESRFSRISKAHARLFGLSDPAQAVGKTDFDFFTQEHAYPAYDDEQQIIRTGWPITKEERETWPDRPDTWVITTKMPLHNQRGEIIGTFGISKDITERKKAEELLHDTNESLKHGLSELDQRNREIMLLNELGNLLQMCQTHEEAYTLISDSVPRIFPGAPGAVYMIKASRNIVEAAASWKTLLPEERTFAPEDCLALRRGRPYFVAEGHSGLQCKHIAGAPSSYICIPMMAQGEALGVFHLQVTQNETRKGSRPLEQGLVETVADSISLALTNLKLRETLRNQSIRDPLTDLFNRRFMEESFERELHRATRNQRSLGIIMLDIDHFKKFNDTFGHEAGDAVLHELGIFLKHHIRGGDIACRYGGEEFLLLLPEASLEVTRQHAQKLCNEARRLQIQYRGELLGPVTLSLGVAVFPKHGQLAEDVVRAADAALYRAKQEGRNQVIVADVM